MEREGLRETAPVTPEVPAKAPVRWRRALLGPVGVTAVLAVLTAAAGVAVLVPAVLQPAGLEPAGFVLAWLLVGLTAGYALSGSA